MTGMKTFIYAVLGFLIATVVQWGGLAAWAAICLGDADSYWDRTPYAADLFVTGWIVFGLSAALSAAWWSRSRGVR